MLDRNIENLFNFKEKIFLITGSSGQIGSSFCKLFLDLGAKVYGIDTSKNKLNIKTFFLKKLILQKNIVQKIIHKIVAENKKIDVIINNAGYSVFTKYYKRTKKELDKTINVNVIGALNIINSYLKIYKNKNLKQCNIINIGSIYGLMSPDFRIYGKSGNYNSEIYGATKASVIQLTKYYSVILSDLNINVNCLSPGGLYNNKKPQRASFVKNYSSRVPKARMANAEDLHTGIIF